MLTVFHWIHRRRRHKAGGGTCPQQNLWGICKKNKKINEKAKYSAKEVFSVSSLGNGHCHSSTALSITLCFMSAQTAVRHRFSSSTRQPVSQSGKRNPESTPIFCDWIQV